jgi:hypothetical protein
MEITPGTPAATAGAPAEADGRDTAAGGGLDPRAVDGVAVPGAVWTGGGVVQRRMIAGTWRW